VFVRGVAGGLELEGGVLDVEVPGQALLQLVQQPCPSRKQESSTTTCAVSTGRSEATELACRSCTACTCGTPRMWARTWARSTSFGVASISTSTVSRSSFHARGKISAPISSEATASARSQPVSATAPAAASTATEPSASLMTSSRAARVFRFPPEILDSSTIETTLPASPATPKTAITPEATTDGSTSRRIASARTNPPTASSTAACAAAASTSARRYPQVRAWVAGRPASTAAARARDSPATSASICPASASRASDPDTTAPITSTARMAPVMASTTASGRRCPAPGRP
jgi:hypothetical protein